MVPTAPAAELWTWLRNWLRPSPSFLHFLLTHGRWFWEFINATFIRDTLMRLVLTGERRAQPPGSGEQEVLPALGILSVR